MLYKFTFEPHFHIKLISNEKWKDHFKHDSHMDNGVYRVDLPFLETQHNINYNIRKLQKITDRKNKQTETRILFVIIFKAKAREHLHFQIPKYNF